MHATTLAKDQARHSSPKRQTMQEKMRKVRWGLVMFYYFDRACYFAGERFIKCAFNLKKLKHTLGIVSYQRKNKE